MCWMLWCQIQNKSRLFWMLSVNTTNMRKESGSRRGWMKITWYISFVPYVCYMPPTQHRRTRTRNESEHPTICLILIQGLNSHLGTWSCICPHKLSFKCFSSINWFCSANRKKKLQFNVWRVSASWSWTRFHRGPRLPISDLMHFWDFGAQILEALSEFSLCITWLTNWRNFIG